MRTLTGLAPRPSPAPWTTAPATAILDEHLERSPSPLCVAFSGGGDSTALLLLALAWAAPIGRPVIALTVDHGLHPDSAAWTLRAGEVARAAGAEWRPLLWNGPRPKSAIQETARLARHKLLANAARSLSARVILFGHTLDDVLEEEMLRLTDAPTIGRLRAWSPAPVWPEGRGVFILRPLIRTRRANLRQALQEGGASWFDDPANGDERFARVRARKHIASAKTLLATAAWNAAWPGAERWSPLQIAPIDLRGAAASAETDTAGVLEFRHDALTGPVAQARRLIATAAICASGAAVPPRGAPVERLRLRLCADEVVDATLAGARILRRGVGVMFLREAGELRRHRPADLILGPGDTGVWDGRFEIAAEASLRVLPLAGIANSLTAEERRRLRELPSWARPSLPVLATQNGVSLPRPLGLGPGSARALARERLWGAWGLVAHENDISHDAIA